MSENLQLVEPRAELQAEFAAYCAEFESDGHIHGIGGMSRDVDFLTAVRRCQDWAQGHNLPAGYVPSHTFWLLRDDRTLVGMAGLRHILNAFLAAVGGHIGYSVRPSERGKGYATQMLALTLDQARGLGLKRVLITCDQPNQASARVIQKNGGVLQDEVPSHQPGGPWVQRYWIELG